MRTYEYTMDVKQLTHVFSLTDYDIVFKDEIIEITKTIDIDMYKDSNYKNMKNKATLDLIKKAIEEQWTFRIVEDEHIMHIDEYGNYEFFYNLYYELISYSWYDPYEQSSVDYKFYQWNPTKKDFNHSLDIHHLNLYKQLNTKYPNDFYKIKKSLKTYTNDGIPYVHWNKEENKDERYYIRANDILYFLIFDYQVTKRHKNTLHAE